MKLAIIVAVSMLLHQVASVSGGPSAPCLYCRRMDVNAGVLTSYSYCNQTDECLEDAWNYINRPCPDTWIRGESYGVQFCNATNTSCPGFNSTLESYGQYFNQTWSLAEGAECTITIDATQGLARLVFDSTSYLGVEIGGYRIGNVITYTGGVNSVLIYHGAKSGPLTFEISFSGASRLLASALLSLSLGYTLVAI
jgi:hypothetical protein